MIGSVRKEGVFLVAILAQQSSEGSTGNNWWRSQRRARRKLVSAAVLFAALLVPPTLAAVESVPGFTRSTPDTTELALADADSLLNLLRHRDDDSAGYGVGGRLPGGTQISPEYSQASSGGAHGEGDDEGSSVAVPGGSAAGIPGVVLAAYLAAEDTLAESMPGCGIEWSLLAGIGRIESNHARGGLVDAAGRTLSPILGPRLDGGPGIAAIHDTDGGRLDGDTVWDRAVGPMQFIPSTWAAYASDGDGDGKSDPHNVFDASLAAGRYLCSGGLNLRNDAELRTAVFRYNRSNVYVGNVLYWARTYANGVTPLEGATPPPSGSGNGPNTPPPAPPAPPAPQDPPRPNPPNPNPPNPPQPDPPTSKPTTPPDPPENSEPTEPPWNPDPTEPPWTPGPTDPPEEPDPTDPPEEPDPTDPPEEPDPTDPPDPDPTDPPCDPPAEDPPADDPESIPPTDQPCVPCDPEEPTEPGETTEETGAEESETEESTEPPAECDEDETEAPEPTSGSGEPPADPDQPEAEAATVATATRKTVARLPRD
ncbi:lytic transglycosylase domain-containing protein [Actinoalloteichus hymeniacidonis]|uniref:Transglycosylase SLT domain n=1 Tax=Actinoalloteichus hymeniacidonis TaxID=340345 RepID=A0AAC9MVX2_9PSEU|nr:lytic transglycosylase domain-containing protein [Actinoalloteichus hymeniacidonis]AOS61588.1 Transglycosylase SLT domain [Actinoalloteichus hymeniacidonis]MBB5910402.1 hypothetical protein [Actinoalloteichus hymeniacidonis]